MKRLLITGSSGMLGSNIVHELGTHYKLYGIDNSTANPELQNQFQIDLRSSAKLGEAIGKIRPDFVVHCAALTDVDMCEDNYALAREINALATKHLISTIGSKTRFVYISTDSVFDGIKGNYSEVDIPSPLNNYAKSKLEGEWYVEQEAENYVIIRTNMFGFNRLRGRSFAEWIINDLAKKQSIKMFTDVIFSAISIYTLIQFIHKLLLSDFVGRLNIGVVSSVSKYNFGIHLADKFGFNASLITPISVDEFNFKAKRPKNTSLNISKAEDILGDMPDIDEEIDLFYRKRLNCEKRD
jgi:dTDP-4-dehydrorhamnose reductase